MNEVNIIFSLLLMANLGFAAYPSVDDRIRCSNSERSTQQIEVGEICDNIKQCPNGEDEEASFCKAYNVASCSRGHILCRESSYDRWQDRPLCQSFQTVCAATHMYDCYVDSRICEVFNTRTLPEIKLTNCTNKISTNVFEENFASFLKLVNSSVDDASGCPMFYVNVSNTCYSFLPFEMSWNEALETCKSISGNLAHPENMEFISLVSYLQKNGYSSDFWTGGFFDIVEDAWMWHTEGKMPTGTPFWHLQYKTTCEARPLSVKSGSVNEGCHHYHQTPSKNTPGQCTGMDFDTMFFFSDSSCMDLKRPMCVYEGVN